jgi:hypothetical protein
MVSRLRKQHDGKDCVPLLQNFGWMDDGGINSVLWWVAVHDLGEYCDSMFDHLRRSRGRKGGSAAGLNVWR